MRTRGYETLRLTRSVLASAALSDAVRFLIVMKAFLKDVFEQLGFKQLGLPSRVSAPCGCLAESQPSGPYGVRLSP